MKLLFATPLRSTRHQIPFAWAGASQYFVYVILTLSRQKVISPPSVTIWKPTIRTTSFRSEGRLPRLTTLGSEVLNQQSSSPRPYNIKQSPINSRCLHRSPTVTDIIPVPRPVCLHTAVVTGVVRGPRSEESIPGPTLTPFSMARHAM